MFTLRAIQLRRCEVATQKYITVIYVSNMKQSIKLLKLFWVLFHIMYAIAANMQKQSRRNMMKMC